VLARTPKLVAAPRFGVVAAKTDPARPNATKTVSTIAKENLEILFMIKENE